MSIICFLDLIIIKIYHLINALIGCIKGDSNDFLWPLFQFFISYWQWQRFHENFYIQHLLSIHKTTKQNSLLIHNIYNLSNVTF